MTKTEFIIKYINLKPKDKKEIEKAITLTSDLLKSQLLSAVPEEEP